LHTTNTQMIRGQGDKETRGNREKGSFEDRKLGRWEVWIKIEDRKIRSYENRKIRSYEVRKLRR